MTMPTRAHRRLAARAGRRGHRDAASGHDAVGQVAPPATARARRLGDVGPSAVTWPSLRPGRSGLAVPVQLRVGPVRHQVVDALVRAAHRRPPPPPSTLAITTTGAVIAVTPSG